MMRRFLWAVRRELWENRWLYLAPLAIAAVLLAGYVVYALGLPGRAAARTALDAVHPPQAPMGPYDIVAGFMMAVGVIVAVIYCVDALYAERRDRSILLWKSLPVSDLATVLAKLCIPVLVVPLVVWATTVALHLVMLPIGAAVLAAQGQSASLAWSQLRPLSYWPALFYHLVALHGVYTAPFYAWLLLVSAWAPRAPFAWAVLPPLAIGFLERVAFGTTRFADLLLSRLGGGSGPAPVAARGSMMALLGWPPPWRLFIAPGLWAGFAVAALLVVATTRVRRSAQPV